MRFRTPHSYLPRTSRSKNSDADLAVGETQTLVFDFSVSDNSGAANDTASSKVTITVEGRNDTPIISSVADTTNEGAGTHSLDLLDASGASDVDASDVLSVSTLTQVVGASDRTISFSQVGDSLQFDTDQFNDLAVGESQTLVFDFSVSDDSGGSDSAVVTITITGVNDGPTANDDISAGFTTDEDTAFTTGNVLANDTDPDASDTLSVSGLNTVGTIGLVTDNGDGTFNYNPNGQFETLAVGETATDTFSYTVSDGNGNGGSDTAVVTITINGANNAPTVGAVSPSVVVDEGARAQNMGTFADADLSDNVMISASVGTITQNSGNAGGWSWSFDTSDGPDDSQTVTITADDGNGGEATTTFGLLVNNVAPQIIELSSSSPNPCSASEDGMVMIYGSFFDWARDLDVHTVTVDWGDGTGVETLPAASVDQINDVFAHSHTYAHGGVFTITVVVADEDGGADVESSTAAAVGVGVVDGTLYVVGTDGKDHVDVKLVQDGGSDGGCDKGKHKGKGKGGSDSGHDRTPMIRVMANLDIGGSDGDCDKGKKGGKGGSDGGSDRGADVHFFDPALVERIKIYLCDGDDHAKVGNSGGSDGDSDGGSDGGSDLLVPALIYGGAGRDHLQGGGGNDTIFGGPGDDHLFGGAGDDLLDGGDGKDKLHGNKGNDILLGKAGKDRLHGDSGLDVLIGGLDKDDLKGGKEDDILIGGWVTLDEATLEDVRDVWTSGASYTDRVANLTGTGSLLERNVKVRDDGVKDTLKGDKGRDLFFAELYGSDKDKVKDRKCYEDLFKLL